MVLWSYQAASHSGLRFLPFNRPKTGLFRTFQSARNYYRCQDMIFRENQKVPTPPLPSPLPDSADQKYHLPFSRRLLTCNSCLLFNVPLEQVQWGRAQQYPEHTRCRTRASSSRVTWPTLTTSFFAGWATLPRGVRRCEPWLSSSAGTKS